MVIDRIFGNTGLVVFTAEVAQKPLCPTNILLSIEGFNKCPFHRETVPNPLQYIMLHPCYDFFSGPGPFESTYPKIH